MYMDMDVKRGYNEYLRLEDGPGKAGMMDVGLLVMEAGDEYVIEEPKKEVPKEEDIVAKVDTVQFEYDKLEKDSK